MAKEIGYLRQNINNYEGITSDSRDVKPGYIFVALKGLTNDGNDFIGQAIKKGATAVVGEKELTDLNVDYFKSDDSRETLGELASAFYGNPSEKLKVIGVTGTKGKTTTCHIIYHILTKLGKKTGILSSISVPGLHVTSPDVVFLHKTLKEFVDLGDKYAIIEVSSHGIDQKRIAGIKFDVGVLTNIAPEHLDYHKTFNEYKRVKMSFINSCKEKVIAPKATNISILPGEFNNLNIEAAVAAVEKFGIHRADSLKAAESFELPEGRLTEIPNKLGIKIYVDFAHTPDSLKAVLTYLRSQTNGKLICVFGCAGERDPRKRKVMGKISAEIADRSVFTAEDPRSEKVFDILSKMAEGAISAGKVENVNFVRIPERGEAIAYAIDIAQRGDTIIVAGKGHEKSLAYKGYEHPWNDRRNIENYLERDKRVSAIILAAGKGTRMKSALPKILHEICGRPLITYTLNNLRLAGVGEIIAVLSFRKNLVAHHIGGAIKVAVQKNPKGGTADAANSGLPMVSSQAEAVIVMYGDDTAFYSSETIKKIIKEHMENNNTITFVTLKKDDPHGLGRILRNNNGDITGIIEEKDATDEQRKITEVNDGLYIFDKKWIQENLPKVEKSRVTGEFYLVELIKMAINQRKKVIAYILPNAIEWQGVNTPEELDKARIKMENRLKNSND